MGDNYWELTIEILQGANPVVDKPKLSEKYLTKPPFRFLHDVISGVQAKTGFAPGLFQGDELDGKALQDKDAKVAYLTKICSVVSMVLGQPVPAKPLKIVAGLEPENTNAFLQMLGKACTKGDAAAIVKKVLAGETAAAPAPAEKKSSKPKAEKPKEAEAAPAADAEAPAKPKAKPKPKPKEVEAAPPAAEAPAAAEPAPKKKSSKPKPAPAAEEAPAPAPEAPPPKAKRESSSGAKPKASKPAEADEQPPPMRSASPGGEDPASASAAMAQRVGRPQSARKGPPKLQAGPAAGPTPMPSGARPGTATRQSAAQDVATRPITLFEEGAKGGDDDDDVEVVHERTPVAIGPKPVGEQGVLVKDILDAEKALLKTKDEAADEESGSGIILKRLGKAATGSGVVKSNDHAGMRDLVQRLTQSSHPLAKSMDYLQEDLENMSKEYRFWVTERRVFQEKLGEEQRMAGDQVQADARLADLDGQVRQVRDRIIGLKAQVLRNDETIAKLLGMAVSGGR